MVSLNVPMMSKAKTSKHLNNRKTDSSFRSEIEDLPTAGRFDGVNDNECVMLKE